MHEFWDETGLWATTGSASTAEGMLERGARDDDAISGAVPRKIERVTPRSALAVKSLGERRKVLRGNLPS
jgi:hypothetical protein